MSEDKEQAVTEETEEQSTTVSEENGAQEQETDDLETLLAEFEQETGKSTEQTTETKSDDGSVSREEFEALRQELTNRDFQTDFSKAINEIRGDLPASSFDDEMVGAWLEGRAKKDSRVANAWVQRNNEAQKYGKVLEGLKREFAKKYGKLSGLDDDATSSREAVAAAVRSHGTKAPEGTPPDYTRVSNQDFAKDVREKYGFTPPV